MSEQDAWRALLEALDPDPGQAAVRLAALLDKLHKIFEWRGCADPREAAFEVVDRIATKLRAGATLTTSVEGYANGFIRPVFLELLRKRDQDQQAMEGLKQEIDWHDLAEEREDWLKCLDHCCESLLSPEEQDMLLSFHAYQGRRRIETRMELAQSRGKTANALRIDAHRLRKKLKQCIEPCVARNSDESYSPRNE